MRDTRTFLFEDYDIDYTTFETLIRGCIIENNVFFYKSSYFTKLGYIPEYALRLVSSHCRKKYGRRKMFTVYDGLIPGTYGEQWSAISKWGTIET